MNIRGVCPVSRKNIFLPALVPRRKSSGHRVKFNINIRVNYPVKLMACNLQVSSYSLACVSIED